jgi:hypothetical protein
MSKPDQAATPENGDSRSNFRSKVNDLASKMVENDAGVWVLPEEHIADISDEMYVAVEAEKRRRDAQSEMARTKQKVKVLETEKSKLQEKLLEQARLNISPEKQTELEDLKVTDPEAWRNEMNKLEDESRTDTLSSIENISTEASSVGELELRKQKLDSFLDLNPDIAINEDVIANDIPPRITNKLEKGSVSFDEFLDEVAEYLRAGKVLQSEKTGESVNLSRQSGGSQASENAQSKDAEISYSDEIF